MKKYNVLMIHNYYLIDGGEHAVFHNEVELLRNAGHNVITYTRNNEEINKRKIIKFLGPFSTIWSFKTYFEVKKIIKKEKIDIVHCHNTFPLISPSVYYAARSLKIPVLQTIHNFRFICPNGLFNVNNSICEKCLEKESFRFAVKNKCYRNSKVQTLVVILMLKFHRLIKTYNKISYIFLTDFNKNKFSKLININSDNVYIKPNFFDNTDINKNIKKSDILKEKFIFVGRLDENKGIKFLVDSWNSVPKKYELHIYGDGKLRKYVENSCYENQNIKYYGFQTKEIIFDDLVESYGLVFPSESYEGFPMTIIESFSIGKPVLSTDIGNQKVIIEDSKGGVLFKKHDKKDFVNGIKKIVNNYDKYSKNSLNYYNDNLRQECNLERLIEIYEKAKHIEITKKN